MTCLCYTVIISFAIFMTFQDFILFSRPIKPISCKEPSRYDYAASDPGGKILRHSAEVYGAKGILKPDKDKYLLVPCSQSDKWVEISLLETILIDEIQFIQGEIYSSSFKNIEIQYSIDYPTESWQHIITIDLEETPKPQKFKVDNIWVRFLRIVFLSHYGNEYYCTLSQFSVFGSSIFQQLNEDYIKHKDEINKNLTGEEGFPLVQIEEKVQKKFGVGECKANCYYDLECGLNDFQGYENKDLKSVNVLGEMVKHMAKTEITMERMMIYLNRLERVQKNYEEKYKLLEKHFAMLELQVLENAESVNNLKFWVMFCIVLFFIGMLLGLYVSIRIGKTEDINHKELVRQSSLGVKSDNGKSDLKVDRNFFKKNTK